MLGSICQNAVLVAIAIPVFTTQLEKAREATDLSNIRSVYAEAALAVLNGTTTASTSSVTGGAITPTADANGYITSVSVASVPIQQQVEGWIVDTSNVAGYAGLGTDFKPVKGSSPYTVVFTFGTDGRLTKIAAGS